MRTPRRVAAGLIVLGAAFLALSAEEGRQACPRRLAYAAGRLRFDADDAGDGATLAASVYSLPASFFDAATATTFLTAVRALDRRRRILVVTDPLLGRDLAGPAGRLRLDLLVDSDHTFSPWPRDPFSLLWDRRPAPRVVVLVRPNLQPGREADADLGRTLAERLPADLDRAWGGVRWSLAPVPFHNGQVLLAAGAAWISLHTLEPRLLALLGESRVPVDSFETLEGIERYLAAAHRAAAELAELYGRPVRFVHPLPDSGPLLHRTAAMNRLGGGAGYDVDSLLTFLPRRGGKPPRALVAAPGDGAALLGRCTAADLAALAALYGLEPAELPAQLAAAQSAPRPVRLAAYLDEVAGHLAAAGFAVDRLPLLFVPIRLLRDTQRLEHPDFLLTWNNVVVETRRGVLRAEGFASGIPTADVAAEKIFTRAGARLDLLPPLVASVVRNGGYRCASNHLRRKG